MSILLLFLVDLQKYSMTSVLKVLFLITLFLVVMILWVLRWFSLYQDYQLSDRQLLKKLQSIDEQASIKTHYDAQGHILRYAELGTPWLQTILFIHGTPWSILDAIPFLEKTNVLLNYHVIVPDRPWFWWSHWFGAVSDIETQSDYLAELLYLTWNSHKVDVVWWSYAGALLPIMTAKNQQKVNSMIIIAWTMDPDNQTIWQISYILHYTALRFIMPQFLRVTNIEKLYSIQELNNATWFRSKITVPVALIHWYKDRIVKIENTLYAKKMLTNSSKVIMELLPDDGHEIPITNPFVIIHMLESLDTNILQTD